MLIVVFPAPDKPVTQNNLPFFIGHSILHVFRFKNSYHSLSGIHSKLIRQTKDSCFQNELVIHGREIDDMHLSFLSGIAVRNNCNNRRKDFLVKREEEIEPVIIVQFILQIPSIIADQPGHVLQTEFPEIILKDCICLRLVFHPPQTVRKR